MSTTDLSCPRCGALATDSAGEGRLVRCEDCGKEISLRAPTCPHCGAPRTNTLAYVRSIKPDWGFEWKSQTTVWGFPLVHIAVGRKDGRLRVAKGVIAIGQFAVGLITIAQFGIGILFGFGQFLLGFTVIAQFAIGCLFGVGQFATGYVAVGQFAVGAYALAQYAFGEHVWMTGRKDPQAYEFFRQLAQWIGLIRP